MLLHWCTIHPEGPSSLAAIRFASPIRVRSIRVFPKGAQPFLESPDIIAQTDPEAFFLEVFFNAHLIHPISQSDSKEKQRATNALVPSLIAYAGNQMEFTVDMGTEYATRLMIVKGNFDTLSMALYGDIVSELPLPSQAYEPSPIPLIKPLPLSRAVDPANALDPTLLAKQLLSLIPDSPPLPVVIRLMFCLKPSDEDWDHLDFPYLNPDLDAEVVDYDLEKALHCTSKPVRDNISYEFIMEFVSKVVDSIGAKSSDQSYQIARLLCNVASQHPDLSRVLLQQLDLSSIFDSQHLDESTVLRLLHASANVDVAQHLNNEAFLNILYTVQDSDNFDEPTQLAVRRLVARIQGWQIFEDALSNTQGDFGESTKMLKDVGSEESSLGIWLESMIMHDDLVDKLAENLVLPVPQSPPSCFGDPFIPISHNDFMLFLRAYIGVSSVLAVWGWTDSVGNEICRERTLSVLRLWQSVDGYREIVNHLLLLRQFTSRLQWITVDNDSPRKSAILGEQILVDLAKEPRSILQDGLIDTILSLTPPLSFISEHERLSMRKIALVADDGLPAAIEELTFSSGRPLSLRRLRTLRVSLAIVEQELRDDKGEWHVFQALWDGQSHGFVSRLADIFLCVADDLNGHFVLASPPGMNQTLVDELFRTADDLLRQIVLLNKAYPLTGRSMRGLIAAVADVFACTDAAEALYSQSSSAQRTRQTCLNAIRSLSEPHSYSEPGKLAAEIILRTLLEHGEQSSGRDPANHLLQVFKMIDHVLPEPYTEFDDSQQSYWVTSVFPNVLSEIESFMRILDPENKVHLVKRLVRLDNGVIGIGQWLLVEELKHLYENLQILIDGIPDVDDRLVRQRQVSLSLHFIHDLLTASSSASTWCIESIASFPDLAHHLTNCLLSVLNGQFTSSFLAPIAQVLGTHSATFDSNLRFAILVTLLRVAHSDEVPSFPFHPVLDILRALPPASIMPDLLQIEIGRTLSAFATGEIILRQESSDVLLAILKWILEQGNPNLTNLRGITAACFSQLCDRMRETVSSNHADVFDTIQSKIRVDEYDTFLPATVSLPETLEFSIQSIEDLLRPEPPAPSTPKGKKTPDILNLVTLSPPMAILRSPAATGLTKTYANNDFRQLRHTPSTRQNTSRLPSMHVDDFEVNSPALVAVPMPDPFQSVLNTQI